jgi:signal transduction histidine kinase
MKDCLKMLEPVIAAGDHHGSDSENNIFSIASENEITILEYLDNKLIWWSDNAFDVPLELNDTTYTKPFIFLQNGWFLTESIKAGNEVIVGLLRVRTDFGFENEIIRNGFVRHFRMPADAGLSIADNGSGYRVFNTAGEYLFSLSFPEVKSNTGYILIPLIFWTMLFILFVFLSNDVVKFLSARGLTNTGLLICLIVLGLIYMFLLFYGRPEVVFRTELFSSHIFSLNGFIPSLGHLTVLSILAADFTFMLFSYLAKNPLTDAIRMKRFMVIILLLVSAGLAIIAVHFLFSHLITDSNISFEAYKVLKLNFYSFAGFTSVILLSLVPLLLIVKAMQLWKAIRNDSVADPDIEGNRSMFNLTAIFSIVLGLYALGMILINSEKKTTENMKIQALTLSAENDPEAEHLLLDMWPEMMKDTILKRMMDDKFFQDNDASIIAYLRDTYLNGYWGNYNYTVTLCRNDDPLQIGQKGELVDNCFGFFNERIRKYGHQLSGTGFWFIENQGGRSYYLGQLFYRQAGTYTNGLFIELYGNIDVFQPGYSELLLDKKFRGYSGLRDYSFVKYINGDIVLKSGDFAYNKSDVDYIDEVSDYRIFTEEKFNHILYRNGNATVIISRPEINAGNILITLAYLFGFTFVFTNLLMLLIRRPGIRKFSMLNFRQKLQLSFITILLLSFMLIGIVVSSITIKEYRSRHSDNITEKLNSIYLELENKIAGEEVLRPDWRSASYSSLNEMLIRLSNIFNTDINLYDLNGFLIATSREEIFTRELTGLRINNMAWNHLRYETKSFYSQTEMIGKMQYVSVYVPFFNVDNEVLVYLNLPYFRMQSLLARDISNLVIAVINFTLLLIIITMSLAVFISGRLTSPLTMLSGGLASVKLGKKSEHLGYKSSDEIGELVKQYNRMVDELDESARKLADTEREYAWREMAKQIAHEIKNPLTPMKLNVQQLLKSWNDGIPDFGEKIESFSRNQIEYIDNLSSIASAFSSFAKMPGTSPAEVDLLEQVRSTLELFRNTDNVQFIVTWPHESKIFILSDREQLNGIFSNLFKNSIQAIPPDRKGVVKVVTEIIRDKVVISVHDNGDGIPEELKKKMFTPNFTTKSSGTGLGLSIVKRYVEGAGGRVWFESEAGKGTVFHIEFPLKYTVERPGAFHND